MNKIVSTLLVATAALLLTACGDEKQSVTTTDWSKADLYYTYPMHEQQEVVPSAPVVLAFLGEINVDEDTFVLQDEQGEPVDFDIKIVNNSSGVVITPRQPLKTFTEYRLTAEEIKSVKGRSVLPEGGLRFTTRPALSGSLNAMVSSSSFEVEAVSPDGDLLPFLDFSSVNIRLTQPLNEATVVYGDSIKLLQNGELVPANLLVKGRYITLDPLSDQGFTADAAITIELNAEVENRQGDSLIAFSKVINAKDTHPRITLVQEVPAATEQGSCGDEDAAISPLTGDAINCVPVIAKLLGNNTTSKQMGNTYAELGFSPRFPDATPLRIKKGALLKGDALTVMVGGEVPAGFDSGEVTVTFLADANGYLLNNPYSKDPEAPKRLLLNLDLAFDTADSRANGAFTQDLLQVTLVGTAIANPHTGSLVIEALGVVEPRVLGLEDGYGMLSFHMESYPDQDNLPVVSEQPEDERLLDVQAWQPGSHSNSQQAGDPIVINFTKPLDKTTVRGGSTDFIDEESLLLKRNGEPVKFAWYLDGTSLVLKPENGLVYSKEGELSNYEVVLKNHIQDLAGNSLRAQTLSFAMPVYSDERPQAPLVLTAYPGFPCVVEGVNLAQNSAGRCVGGAGDDDELPLARLPSNRSIYVTFSQPIDTTSVNENTFVVEELDVDGQVVNEVAGKVETNGRSLRFTPQQVWQEGRYYRYRLNSQTTDAVCGESAICDTRGLPLQTRVLFQKTKDALKLEPTDGGPNMAIHFKAVASSNSVLQHLRNAPTADINANQYPDAGELKVSEDENAVKNSAKIVRVPQSNGRAAKGSGLAAILNASLDANVGCGFDGSSLLECPDQKYSALTGNLDVDIVGYKTPAEVAELVAQEMDEWGYTRIPESVQQKGAVLTYIHPTQIVVSNATIYINMGLSVSSPPTGPQFMRIRYTCEVNNCTAPDYGLTKGWIVEKEDGSGAEYITELDLYLDAPRLDPEAIGLKLSHNLHSYPMNLKLAGDLTFLADGRLQIEQISQEAMPLEVLAETTGISVNLYVEIPAGGTVLNYLSEPIKQ